MPEEPSLGEVARRLEAVHQDLKEDLRDLAGRLDSKVSLERYQLEQHARDEAFKLLLERVKGIEDAREREARTKREEDQKLTERRSADRRLILTALVVPLLLVLLQAFLNAQGAGS